MVDGEDPLKGALAPRVERRAEDEPAPGPSPAGGEAEPAAASADMDEVDRILDKILSDGLESLTDDERGIVHRYSERNKPS